MGADSACVFGAVMAALPMGLQAQAATPWTVIAADPIPPTPAAADRQSTLMVEIVDDRPAADTSPGFRPLIGLKSGGAGGSMTGRD